MTLQSQLGLHTRAYIVWDSYTSSERSFLLHFKYLRFVQIILSVGSSFITSLNPRCWPSAIAAAASFFPVHPPPGLPLHSAASVVLVPEPYARPPLPCAPLAPPCPAASVAHVPRGPACGHRRRALARAPLPPPTADDFLLNVEFFFKKC